MKSPNRVMTLAVVLALLFAGCSERPAPGTNPETTVRDVAAESVTDNVVRYSAREFFDTTAYRLSEAPAWSADGKKLLLASDENGTFNVYALPTSGGEPVALTEATDTAQLPVSWFPEDDRVLYQADNSGDELNHLYVREEDGSTRDLTPGENLKASFFGWSQDSDHFYVLTNERDAASYDLYRYRASDYARERVFENTVSWSIDALSPDGRYLLLARDYTFSARDLFIKDLENREREPLQITRQNGDINHQGFAFSADSGAVIYGTDEHGEFLEAWTYDIDSGKRSPRLQTGWNVESFEFSPSGRYEVARINEDASTKILITDTQTGKPVPLDELPPGQIDQIRFAPDDSRIALMIRTDTSPRDVYTVDLESGTLRRLTTALSSAIDESSLVGGKIVRYRSFDGLEIPGILYRPHGASADSPVPALVWVHGGPGGQSKTGYISLIQHLVNHGYAVLMANNRGSWGYGKTFYRMDDRKHGTVDLDDIVFGGRYLAGLDWVDGERIGVIGGSYGGYLVGAALAFRPGEFKVGVNIFGVMNWVRTLESMPVHWENVRAAAYNEMGDPSTDRERLLSISPLEHADRIKTPFLVVQGANDPRVLKVESDEIVAAVRANGVPVEYLVFDDEGHGFKQKANRIAASEAYVNFLSKHL